MESSRQSTGNEVSVMGGCLRWVITWLDGTQEEFCCPHHDLHEALGATRGPFAQVKGVYYNLNHILTIQPTD